MQELINKITVFKFRLKILEKGNIVQTELLQMELLALELAFLIDLTKHQIKMEFTV